MNAQLIIETILGCFVDDEPDDPATNAEIAEMIIKALERNGWKL